MVFIFQCLRSSSSSLPRHRVSSPPCCLTYIRLRLSYSVFGFHCSVLVPVLCLSFSASRCPIQNRIHPCLRSSVKAVHVFVSANSGSSLLRLQCKGCPCLRFGPSCCPVLSVLSLPRLFNFSIPYANSGSSLSFGQC